MEGTIGQTHVAAEGGAEAGVSGVGVGDEEGTTLEVLAQAAQSAQQ